MKHPDDMTMDDAPPEMSNEEAHCWMSGYEAGWKAAYSVWTYAVNTVRDEGFAEFAPEDGIRA